MMGGDAAKARTAYQDFLTIWRDADPDIPILKQARAEYGKAAVVDTAQPRAGKNDTRPSIA